MKFTIGSKLLLGFGTVLVLMVVSAGLSFRKSMDIKEIEHFILSSQLSSIQAADRLTDDLDYSGSKGRQAILAGSQPARKEASQAKFDAAWNRIEKTRDELDELSQHWIHQENKDRWASVKESLPKVRAAQQAMINEANAGTRDAVVRAGDDYAEIATPVVDAATKALGELSNGITHTIETKRQELDSANSAMAWTVGMATLTALAVGLIVAIFLSRGISNGTLNGLGAGRGHCWREPDR